MGKRAWLLGSSIAVLAAFIAACSSNSGSPAAPSGAGGSTDAKPGGTSAYQLNLSHIECVEGGQVEIHFVLLHVPDGITPGSLNWSNNNVAQTPVAPTRRTGNVWHYNILVAPGTYNVTSASVLVNGVTVNLHNPGAYAVITCAARRPAPVRRRFRPAGRPKARRAASQTRPQLRARNARSSVLYPTAGTPATAPAVRPRARTRCWQW